jgi:hypothetical protein
MLNNWFSLESIVNKLTGCQINTMLQSGRQQSEMIPVHSTQPVLWMWKC